MVRNHNDSSNLEDDLISSDVDYECYSLRVCDNNDMSIEAVFAREEIISLNDINIQPAGTLAAIAELHKNPELPKLVIPQEFRKYLGRLEGLRVFLSNYHGEICDEFLDLDGLRPELAKVLATYKGRLSISVDSLSRESAQALSDHTGLLEIDGLGEITTGVAAALARHKGTLDIDFSNFENEPEFIFDSDDDEVWPDDFYSDEFEAAASMSLFGEGSVVGTECLKWFVRLKGKKMQPIQLNSLPDTDHDVQLLADYQWGLHFQAFNPYCFDLEEAEDYFDLPEERERMFERLAASLKGLKGQLIHLNGEDCEDIEEEYVEQLLAYDGQIVVWYVDSENNSTVDELSDFMLRKDEEDEEWEDGRGLVERIRSQKVEELESMIGLDEVKSEVKQLIDFLEVQQERKRLGKKNVSISNHLVFSGNPGTGKTTVARIVGAIYHSMGFLSSGHVVEVSRSDLCGVFIGETGPKTLAKCKEAKGGVLFIDEAYSLVRDTSSGKDFGAEAIDELLKFMEDNREDFVVIVAGYPEKMLTFIDSNPGLKSRFNKTISFADYNPKELLEILAVNCKNADYQLTSEAQDFVQKMYEQSCRDADEQFGNARDVRNRFEAAIKKQASRIVGDESADHSILLPEDFQPWFVS